MANMESINRNVTIAAHSINDVNILSRAIFGITKEMYWWKEDENGELLPRNDGELIALMHSELSEALEGIRKDKMDDHLPHRKAVEVELADAVIRILDYAGAHNLDIGGAIAEMLAYNVKRADHKIENRNKPGGKKF